MKKIVVGMSGGVDSAVSAYLLQQQGFDVHGVFMKNWEDPVQFPEYRAFRSHGCSWEQDEKDVQDICALLGISYTRFDFVKEYADAVFSTFIQELKAGRTPNPDITCNQEIKFRLFLDRALAMPGVDGVATGHYAAVTNGLLTRPKDLEKDQTYFLYRIPPKALASIHFPLAGLTKKEVRAIARERRFPNAEKKDSTGICFIGDIDYNAFINEHIERKPGTICLQNGTVVGTHEGMHFYTIGQRKGIQIGGTGPYYVTKKDIERNIVIVTNDKNDPSLFQTTCRIEDLHWFTEPTAGTYETQVRYRQKAAPSTLSINADQTHATVTFAQPQRAIAPGQSAVWYRNNMLIGGGIIQHAT